MIHEEWGLTAWVRGNADRLAADGYAVLAVDLFAGKTTDDPAAARDLMRNMSLREARADLRLGVSFLLAHLGIDNSRKVGAIGWSMGGGLARELAETTDAISPAAICYGAVTTHPAEVNRLIGKPILGIFGEGDVIVAPDRVREFGAMLAERKSRLNFKIYPNAAHNFMRPDNPQYSPDDARPAWVAIEDFFSVALKGMP